MMSNRPVDTVFREGDEVVLATIPYSERWFHVAITKRLTEKRTASLQRNLMESATQAVTRPNPSVS
jgi:hypothetical protein